MKHINKKLIILLFFSIILYAELEECRYLEKNSSLKLKHDCQREQDLNSIAKALEKSFQLHFNYTQPERMHLDTSISEKKSWSKESDLNQLKKDKLIFSLPLDPINNTEYYYMYEPLNYLYHPYYQLCASKLETTKLPYCITPKKHTFYSDHLFITTQIKIKDHITPLTIVTANILYGGGSPISSTTHSTLTLQASLLKSVNPDIVLFQEVELYSPRTLTRDKIFLKDKQTAIDYFSYKLNLPYFYFVKSSSLQLGVSGKLFLSKYPIISQKKLNRHLFVVGIDIDNDKKEDIFLANMHLKPKGLKGTYKKMIIDSVKKLLLSYQDYPIILGGDFFFHDLDLTSLGFSDTYRLCGHKNDTGLKYFNTVIHKKPRRLDYIFIYGISCIDNTHDVLRGL